MRLVHFGNLLLELVSVNFSIPKSEKNFDD